MKQMCSFSWRTSAPSTVQYQSIISRRRLVCSTICDSFLGDAMISSLALHFRRIGASEIAASQQRSAARLPLEHRSGAAEGVFGEALCDDVVGFVQRICTMKEVEVARA